MHYILDDSSCRLHKEGLSGLRLSAISFINNGTKPDKHYHPASSYNQPEIWLKDMNGTGSDRWRSRWSMHR